MWYSGLPRLVGGIFLTILLVILCSPAIAQERSEAANDALAAISMLGSADSKVREKARKNLEKAGPEALQPVFNALQQQGIGKLPTESILVELVSGWADSWKGEKGIRLYERLNSEDGRRIKVLDDLRIHAQLVETVKQWLAKETSISIRSGDASIRDWKYSEREAKLLGMLPDIKTISVFADVPDEFFACLKNSPVESLSLQVSRFCMKEDVELPQKKLGGTAMTSILQIPSLSKLKLHRIQLGRNAAKLLSASKNISELQFQYSGATELALICEMKQLESLKFLGKIHGDPVAVSAADLSPVAKLVNLKELEVGFLDIDSEFNDVLKKLPDLCKLGLMFPSDELLEAVIEDETVGALTVFPILPKTDQTARLLSKSTHLKSVSIQGMSMTDVGLNALLEMESLESLTVMGGFFSKDVIKKAERRLKKSGFLSFVVENVSPENSMIIHNYSRLGLLPNALPNQSQFFVFDEHWTGAEEDFASLIKSGHWRILQTDIPLSHAHAELLLAEIADGKRVVVYDSGQHSMGVIDKFKDACESRTVAKWNQMMFPEQGTGDCWLFKK